jgi:hypothetical protein
MKVVSEVNGHSVESATGAVLLDSMAKFSQLPPSGRTLLIEPGAGSGLLGRVALVYLVSG